VEQLLLRQSAAQVAPQSRRRRSGPHGPAAASSVIGARTAGAPPRQSDAPPPPSSCRGRGVIHVVIAGTSRAVIIRAAEFGAIRACGDHGWRSRTAEIHGRSGCDRRRRRDCTGHRHGLRAAVPAHISANRLVQHRGEDRGRAVGVGLVVGKVLGREKGRIATSAV